MDKYHVVEDVCIEDGFLRLVVDGVQIAQPLLALSPLLAQASLEQQNLFEVSPSGYGIYWPLLDEDLAIDGLLGADHTSHGYYVTRRKDVECLFQST
ncbi:MAG: DUF2442 domain-containing protein [Chloroflexi bacterium]|nr:DUF2442 domain-containing protein [Chloroflexota bacterium]